MSFLKDWFLRKKLSTLKVHPSTQGSIARTISDTLSAAGLTTDVSQTGAPSWSRLRKSERSSAHERHRSSNLEEPGLFLWSAVGEGAETLDYKLYLPTSYAQAKEPVPLIVMLHGCSQDPDDFALGTRMNAVAEKERVIVAYPQQPLRANRQKCWNWFLPEDQARNTGEPKRIAAMTNDLMDKYQIDRRRVFVAGMSAGGAMALIMARTYPDLFAAVGVHSGLPYQCASNVVSALSAMRNSRSVRAASSTAAYQTPLIVFRGDKDRTVDPGNSDAIVRQALQDWPASALPTRDPAISVNFGNRKCERTIYRERNGDVAIETWLLHGAGHQWSGGDARGSHTDASGPDASAHMVKFFLELRRGKL